MAKQPLPGPTAVDKAVKRVADHALTQAQTLTKSEVPDFVRRCAEHFTLVAEAEPIEAERDVGGES